MSPVEPSTPSSAGEERPWFRRRQELERVFRQAADYLLSGWRHRLLTLLFLLLTVAVIAAILADNWTLLTQYPWQLQPAWLGFAFLFLLFDMFLGAWAWHLLVTRMAAYSVARRNVKHWWYANLARRVPGTVWYIASRVALYEQDGVARRTVSVLSGLELALIFISGIATTLLTLPFWALPAAVQARLTEPGLWLLLLPAVALLVHPRILQGLWQRLSAGVPTRRLAWRDTLIWLTFYIFVWFVGGLVLFCLIRSFQPLPFQQLIPVVGMWALAGSISLAGTLTLTGLGLREVSLTLLLAQLIPTPVALIIAILIRLIWLAGELITALFSLKL